MRLSTGGTGTERANVRMLRVHGNMRKYRDSEEPSVGDCVKQDGSVIHAFDTSIIVAIECGVVSLERPHMTIDAGSSNIKVERYSATMNQLVKHYSVFVTGRSERIDNRDY